jgi:hypothetical protein
MFGHMKAQPMLAIGTSSIDEAVAALLAITDDARPVRWIEFRSAILLFVTVLDRKTSTWFWIDFEDRRYGGYSVSDFDLLVQEYDFLSLVERPGLLRATPGWLLEPRKPAEMAAPSK